MQITIIQILALAFSLFALSRVFLRFKDKEIVLKEFLLWTAVWVAVIVVALTPGITFFISNLVGVGRGIDVAVYAGIVVLFYAVFRIYVQVEKIEQKLSKIVEAVALRKKK